jgi:hypothetical protein
VCQLAWVVVTACVVVVPRVVADAAELVVPDGREGCDAVRALVAAWVETLAATSIARPMPANAAKLRTVATTRARAAA